MLRYFGRKKREPKLALVDTSRSGTAPGTDAIPQQDIRAQLERILKSKQFARSERLSRFLRYIVEQSLLGNSEQLKEYSLAAEVYKRPPSFDPQVDSIVRAEATRLRSKLEQYYEEEGLGSRIVISVPKGGYTPVFRTRDLRASPFAAVQSRIRSLGTWRLAACITVLAGIGVYLGATWVTPGTGLLRFTKGLSGVRRPSGDGKRPITLAVLPLAHLGADNQAESFADGLTEELIEELSHLPGMRVVSRTSSFHFKGKTEDIRRIGQQLGVGMVLEGSVRKTGDRLRVMVQLTQVSDGYQLWSGTYDRDVSGFLATQREIAIGVASLLQPQLVAGSWGWPQNKPPGKIEAHNVYLKGRYFAAKWSAEGLKKAIECHEKAIQLDPEFARAHAELAEAYCELGIHAGLSRNDVVPKATSAAQRALALDSTLGHAHAALGLVRGIYEWDWKGAEQEFERAHTVDPMDPDVHEAWVMGYLAPTGRLDEALKQIQEAQVLDPVSPRINSVAGMIHYFSGRYDQAIAEFRKALELDPNFDAAYLALGLAYEQKAAFDEAIAAIQKGRTVWQSGMERTLLGHTYALMGRKAEAEAVASELAELSKRGHVSPAQIAVIYAALGRKDDALDWLEKAWQQRSAALAFLKVNPRYVSLRAEPRFVSLLKRINLQE